MTTYTVRAQGRDSQGHLVTVDKTVTVSSSAVKPRAGATVSGNSDWAPFESAMGAMDVRRTYGGAIGATTTFASSAPGTAGDSTAGRESVFSFKPTTMATFGTTDTTAQNNLLAYLRSVPVGHKLTILCYHEPEDNITGGSFTVAQWKAAVVKTGQLVDQVNTEKGANSNLRNAVAYMGPWTFDSRSAYDTLGVEVWTAAELATIDVIGIDPYFWNAGDPSMEQMLTKDDSGTLSTSGRSTMTKLVALGKPIQVMEWGTTRTGRTDAQRAADITAFYNWANAWNAAHPTGARFESLLYFHLDPNVDANHRDLWKVITFPQAQAALRAIFDDMRAP